MGDFTMFKCQEYDNLLIDVLYERHLTPLEIIFNLKFDVAITDKGMLCPEENFYHHLKHKLGLFNVENELLKIKWVEGWRFLPYNTRYTYEHSWEAVRRRQKTSHLGIDIVLTAPDELKKNREKLREECHIVAGQIAKLICFQPSEYVKLVSCNPPKSRKKKNG